jgi:hypothetical protein
MRVNLKREGCEFEFEFSATFVADVEGDDGVGQSSAQLIPESLRGFLKWSMVVKNEKRVSMSLRSFHLPLTDFEVAWIARFAVEFLVAQDDGLVLLSLQ